ncbi:MAG: TetR family regulatory protein [Proteobacteria bacterium]|nr:TetR family regulatory protein [Pseudomonadota bacterium]
MNTGSHFAVKRAVAAGDKDLPAPMQERSRATASRFVNAAMQLLREKTYAELSVAELARVAGRSVGVFYQRFGSKDDFLAVLLSAFFDQAMTWRTAMPVAGGPAEVYRAYLREGFTNLLDHKNLWHAALERSAADPSFWSTYGAIREHIGGITRAKIEAAMGRPLTDAERHQVALAGQVFNSVINNQIINGPGPLMLEHDDFYPELEKIVMNIAQLP